MPFLDEVRANARDIYDVRSEQERIFRDAVVENFKNAVLETAQAGVRHGFVSGLVSVRKLAPTPLKRDFYNYGYKEYGGNRRQRIGVSETAIRITQIVLAFAKEENINARVCLNDPLHRRRWELETDDLTRITLRLRGMDDPVSVADSRISIRFDCQI